jgi:hypothetical protein
MGLNLKVVGDALVKINRSLDELRCLLENQDMPYSAKICLTRIKTDLESAKADMGG